MENAKKKYSQYWDEWILNDALDFVVPMNYVEKTKDFEINVKKIAGLVPVNKVLVGISVYNSDVKKLKEKIKIVFRYPFMGFSIFSYTTLKKNREMFEFFINNSFLDSE